MKDEFEYLEKLFCDTYKLISSDDQEEMGIINVDKDISEKLYHEFDNLKRSYFAIAGQGKDKDTLQSMFEFRAKRLLGFKDQIESKLKDALNDLIIPEETDEMIVYYKNLYAAYDGVVDLLKFIIDKLFVALDDALSSDSLNMKYDDHDIDQVMEWHEEFNKKYKIGDDCVIVDNMTIDTRRHSESLMQDPTKLEALNRLMQSKNEAMQEDSSPIGNFIWGVKNIIRSTKINSNDQKILYTGLVATLDKILKNNDRFKREEQALDLLIETNLAPQETYDFAVKQITESMSGKSENIRFEILMTFKKRLYILKDSPLYPEYHLSNIMTLVDVSLEKLMVFVEDKLKNYDSSLLKDSESIHSLDKIKTQLTVAEIALLFKLLVEENIVSISKKELSKLTRQVAATFSSKKEDNVSYKSIRKHYDSPDSRAINGWDEKLVRLRYTLKKY